MDVDNPLTVTQDKVTIDGADSPKPIISGLGAELWTDGIDIQASNVTIQDMEVLNFTAFSSGIKISSGLNNIIDNCRN
ncbi:MAG: hypothetical protein U5R49_01065 [Deltaproteobacteria bacterium]|nr:hypothetical protein [Deltaproteobacteria bacterium]